MCGIVGYVGPRDVLCQLLDGLERLEYRGYDSAGVAWSDPEGTLHRARAVGRVDKLRVRAEQHPAAGMMDVAGIGHTRWATHGPPAECNAHPHLDARGALALVHNGIVDGHDALRAQATDAGHRLEGDTDTEALAHALGRQLARVQAGRPDTASLHQAMADTVAQTEGTFALAAITADGEPGQGGLVVARRASPLVVLLGDGEAWIASDMTAFADRATKVVHLEDGDVATVTARGVRVVGADGLPVLRAAQPIPEAVRRASLGLAEGTGEWDHHMRKEISEQPDVIRRLVAAHVAHADDGLRVKLPSLDQLLIARRAAGVPVDRVVITACGTSFHAGLLGRRHLERWAGLPVEVTLASELEALPGRVGPSTLAVAVSQSGETADTLAASRRLVDAGACLVAVCNVPGSSLERLADVTISLQAGVEIGVASTKAFTSQCVVLQLMAMTIARAAGRLDRGLEHAELVAVSELPVRLAAALETEPRLRALAWRYRAARAFMIHGRAADVPAALEGALKLAELTYVPSLGYAAGEMKHGPLAMVDETLPSICLAPSGPKLPKMLSSISELRARKGPVIALATEGEPAFDRPDVADAVVRLPATREALQPLVATLALQLFAYHSALAMGCDVDRPRNLAKSVTVE